eukprot:3948535-Amphidinium_carterae.1
MPKSDVEVLRDHPANSGWIEVMASVEAVVGTSSLGKKMFAFAAASVSDAVLDKKVEDELKKLKGRAEITEKVYGDARTSCEEAVSKMSGADCLNEKRKLTIKYRGWDVPVVVSSSSEEIKMKLAMRVRGWAVQLNLLKALPGEAVLCKDEKDVKVKKIDKSLLSQAEASRTTMNRALKGESIASGDEVEV